MEFNLPPWAAFDEDDYQEIPTIWDTLDVIQELQEFSDDPEELASAVSVHRFEIVNLRCKLKRAIEDTRRLNWIEDKAVGYGKGWICRNSTTGRGFRVHETSNPDARHDLRDAIDRARDRVVST